MSTTMKYASLDLGTIEAVFNKLGGMEGAQRFLRGDFVVSRPVRPWTVDAEGVIHFTLTSGGLTGEQWIARLESLGRRVSEYAKSVLRSSAFRPTTSVITAISVIPGLFWKTDAERTTHNIRAEGIKRGWKQGLDLNPEVACLIREKFSDEELKAMGLWAIVAMHEPICDSGDRPCLLSAGRADGGSWLHAYYGNLDGRWDAGCGFAFGVPQASSV